MTPLLSAYVIVRNEARDLPGCLASLRGVADEVVVVDSGSTDDTVTLARAAGARVIDRPFDGFGPQKQFALEQTTGEWALNIDADERLSPSLGAEIRRVLATDNDINGYRLPFLLHFMGRRLRFGGCFREFHLRLFRRGKAGYGGETIHEGVWVEGPQASLSGPVIHESYKNFGEYLEKCARYTGLIARKKHAAGQRFTVLFHLRLPWEFFVRYVLKLGFLDGNAGFTYAALSAYYAWLKHIRIWDEEKGAL